MELFALYFNLLLFYNDLSIGVWITWILKKENPKIESLPPSDDMALDDICIFIYQPLSTSRIRHKVYFSAEFNRFEFRVFVFLVVAIPRLKIKD